ncbi:hypothetical protein [Streptomyces sp. NPDC003688]
MEELMGTQKPAHRILGPDEAIAVLEGVVPGLVALRRSEPAVFDWWHYAGGTVQFLAELTNGTLEPWALPPISPEVTGWGVAGGGWQEKAEVSLEMRDI